MSENTRAPAPPPRLNGRPAARPPLELWTRLPADRQGQLRRLLAQLLARRLEVVRLGEVGHE
jgi:hypothetical protein